MCGLVTAMCSHATDTHEFGGRENVQVFRATFTDVVTSTPFLTFPYGSFFDILVFS